MRCLLSQSRHGKRKRSGDREMSISPRHPWTLAPHTPREGLHLTPSSALPPYVHTLSICRCFAMVLMMMDPLAHTARTDELLTMSSPLNPPQPHPPPKQSNMSSFLVATTRQCCRRVSMLPTTRWTSAPLSVQATTAAASYHKTATGPVGLEVNPNSRDDFIKQQKTLLEKVKVCGGGGGRG